jgi:hypothetical protein
VPSSLVRFLSASFALLVSCQPAVAESQFYAQCHKLLPVADDFARECQQRARPFSRTFYPGGGSRGEVESYSAHFKALDAPSNFVLGCVLDFKRKLNFVGLYYTARPLDMARIDDYQIAFIDPDANVGLQIDGVRHTLVAARQFVTDVIPPRIKGTPQNCDDPHIETINGSNATAHVHFRPTSENQMEYCNGDYCRTARYFTIGLHETPIIYSFHDLFMIDSNGVLMLKDDYFKRACASWKGNVTSIYNVIYEMCSQAK